jgi:hypothetical protein
MARTLDGDRSVCIEHPEKPGLQLKIKGAGLHGGPIRFGTSHRSNLKAPVFDFDGRMMEDVASGHDNAFLGGASFQQAVVEHRVTRILQELGIRVVPCLGYGRIDNGAQVSWFTVFEWDPSWRSQTVPDCSLDEFATANLAVGKLMLSLAVDHRLIGYCWCVGTPAGDLVIKDLHPFRTADPIVMSQVSWAMQFIFSLHIRSLASLFFPKRAKLENVPEDLQAYPFRAVLPEATRADHDDLRWKVIAPYMLKPPEDFDPRRLVDTLRANRIGAAMLDAAPPDFARF